MSGREVDQQARVQQWCEVHGWEGLRREGQLWVAWPPGSYSELPVPPQACTFPDPPGGDPARQVLHLRLLRVVQLGLIVGHVAYLEGVGLARTQTPLGASLAEWPIFGWSQGSVCAFLLAVLVLPVLTIAVCVGVEALFRKQPALPNSL